MSTCHVMIRCHEATPGNINIAKNLNIWATITPHNDNLRALWDAYEVVYLYFNVYRRPFFSGVAKMTSNLAGPFHEGWIGNWKLYGPTFTIDWVEKERIYGDPDFDWYETEDTAIIPEAVGKGFLKQFVEGALERNAPETPVLKEAMAYLGVKK